LVSQASRYKVNWPSGSPFRKNRGILTTALSYGRPGNDSFGIGMAIKYVSPI